MTAIPEPFRTWAPRPLATTLLAALTAAMVVLILLFPRALGLIAFFYAGCAGGSVVLMRQLGRVPSATFALPLLGLAVPVLWPSHSIGWKSIPDLAFWVLPYLALVTVGTLIRLGSARATPWWIAGMGLASFAAFGIGSVWALALSFVFPMLCGLGAVRLVRDAADTTRELHLLQALTIGFAVTWLGVLWNVRPYPQDYASWLSWTQEFHDETTYKTMVVTGFPLQAIEGGPGARDWLPWHKGLWCLLANFGICSAVAFAATLRQRRSSLTTTALLVCAPALVAGLAGAWRMVVLLD